MTRRVAVIGSGVAGLSAADALREQAQVTLFEADARLGGHAHTVNVSLPGRDGVVTHGVDTGFLVYNERTYPGLIAWLQALGVSTSESDMSFSVQAPSALAGADLEWNGATLDTVFADRRNLLRPKFWGMLRDILRFNREATNLATRLQTAPDDAALMQPLRAFLDQHGFGPTFVHGYLLPMLGCIWSCPTDQMLAFPTATMVRFCHNHGLIQVNNRPQWRTVTGGSQAYVQRVAAGLHDVRLATPVASLREVEQGVAVHTAAGSEVFDAVVLACHADQALRLWTDAPAEVAQDLGAIRFQDNEAVLHTDTSVMPKRRKAWAAWNYERAAHEAQDSARVCLHYWINRLQPLPFTTDVLVSLNPVRSIREDAVLGRYHYAHPVFDAPAIRAQQRLNARAQDGAGARVALAGAWLGYGFHEDGFQAGRRAAAQVVRA